MEIKVRILRKGDKVLNAFLYEKSIAIAVLRKIGNVDIVLVEKNEHGALALSGKMTICEGDDSIEVASGDTKIATF